MSSPAEPDPNADRGFYSRYPNADLTPKQDSYIRRLIARAHVIRADVWAWEKAHRNRVLTRKEASNTIAALKLVIQKRETELERNR